jgi:hypothetical protein
MLTIRDSQMNAFRESRKREFEEGVVAMLSARISPDDADVLRSWVRDSLAKALGWGFREEAHLRTLLDLMDRVERGSKHTGLRQSVEALLGDHELSPAARLAVLACKVKGGG